MKKRRITIFSLLSSSRLSSRSGLLSSSGLLPACGLLLVYGLIAWPQVARAATSYDGNRWFQIEISVFSNEDFSVREEELWSPEDLEFGSLSQARRLDEIHKFFQVEDFDRRVNGVFTELLDGTNTNANANTNSIIDLNLDVEQPDPVASGPLPFAHDPDLKFFDFSRDAFLQLPDSESQFQRTNSSIDRSPDHRLLFHGLWRQPVLTSSTANTLYIDGGRQYGEQSELQGTITIRFNRNQDRVVIDANLLLAEFGAISDSGENGENGESELQWTLPEVPDSLREATDSNNEPKPEDINAGRGQLRFESGSLNSSQSQNENLNITRVYQLKQSRDMRSEEFHYLDHPALGIVIFVTPYDLPPPESEFDGLEELETLIEEPLGPSQQ